MQQHETITQYASPTEKCAGLLDAVLFQQPAAKPADDTPQPSLLEAFLETESAADALRFYVKHAGGKQPATLAQLARRLNRDIAKIDGIVSRQVTAILHHPRLQKLEASWRGLRYLTQQFDRDDNIKVRMLDVSWKALVRDLDRCIEFDQSQLFRKIYSAEFDTPGGEPFSVLLGDYEIHSRPSATHKTDDLAALQTISQVSAAAFAPFIAAAHPSMFGLESFDDLQRPMNFAEIFRQPDHLRWRSLREREDSRFLGLTLPRVLMRLPYENNGQRADGFPFAETPEAASGEGYLWGNACYALGGVMLRAFAQTRWPADIRGVQPGVEGGGLVTGLPSHSFGVDTEGVAHKCSTSVMISDTLDEQLAALGFIPMCHVKDTPWAAFYSNASIQQPRKYDDNEATANARLSSMLQYMLCVARMAHYIKVIGREKVGSFAEPSDCESFLNEWLQRYTAQDDEATQEMKAQYPLREAWAQVREHPAQPGSFYCVVYLRPHYQFDGLTAGVKLATELTPPSGY